MQSKILSRKTLLIIIFTGFALSLALFFILPSQSSRQSGAALFNPDIATQEKVNLDEQGEKNFGFPILRKIPKINIDAGIEYVSITPDGAMDASKSRDDVAWFELGPRPGENGSAVIAGHYGWKNGQKAVFDSLYELRKGDKLYIEDNKGAIISFVVRESRNYNPKTDASDVFESNDGKSYLNLITCEGVWDNVSKNYSKRLVVFTDKE